MHHTVSLPGNSYFYLQVYQLPLVSYNAIGHKLLYQLSETELFSQSYGVSLL